MELDDTQPNLTLDTATSISPPPRIVFYGVILIFMLMLIVPVLSIYIFREELRPAQQQRVISIVQFMDVFLPKRPDIGDTLPTVIPAQVGELSADDLLNLALSTPTPSEAILPTIAPTNITPSDTPLL